MGRTRLDLQRILEDTIGRRSDEKQNVYFAPPTGFKLVYDCIIYKRDTAWTVPADNLRYLGRNRYTVTVISTNPDSNTPDKVWRLPMCSKNREFVSDNLYHTVFTLYY